MSEHLGGWHFEVYKAMQIQIPQVLKDLSEVLFVLTQQLSMSPSLDVAVIVGDAVTIMLAAATSYQPRRLGKTQIAGLQPHNFCCVSLGWCLKFCIFNRFSGDAMMQLVWRPYFKNNWSRALFLKL